MTRADADPSLSAELAFDHWRSANMDKLATARPMTTVRRAGARSYCETTDGWASLEASPELFEFCEHVAHPLAVMASDPPRGYVAAYCSELNPLILFSPHVMLSMTLAHNGVPLRIER